MPSNPTVATGIPGGICSIDKIESHPSIDMEDLHGTPITGTMANTATTPGR